MLRSLLIYTFLVLFVFVSLAELDKKAVGSDAASIAPILLRTAVVLNSTGPTVAFTMTNNSKAPIPALRVLQFPSRLVIVKPDGTKVEDSGVAGPPPPNTKVPMLAPGKTTEPDKIDIYEWFSVENLKEPGIYRVYRIVLSKQGEKIVEYKSNEVLILWEAGTAAIDPRTGYPVHQ
jgi:hypothetical protein